MPDIRQVYSQPIDFQTLALQDKDFAKIFTSGHVDFKDATSVRQLTISLLKRDFGLQIELPDDRLCPPVPNRLNYILWLQDIIDSTGLSLDNTYEVDRVVTGLDIGTGSSCIYPLFGCSLRPRWRFLATDIDPKNIQYARQNVQRNALDNRIKICESNPQGPLIPLNELGIERLDFVMTNPPFYTSTESLVEDAAKKSKPPFSACTGAAVEMVTEGGEIAFVKRIFEESKSLADRVQWFSAMFGKLESAREIVSLLVPADKGSKSGAANFAVKEFVQGTKTRRWAVAWSWQSRRPDMAAARGTLALGKYNLPFPSLMTLDITLFPTLDVASMRLNELMSAMANDDFRWNYDPSKHAGAVYAMKNVWSRSARRAKAKDMDLDLGHEIETNREPALVVKMSIKNLEVSKSKGVSLDIFWMFGNDSVLFESFCGMVKREMSQSQGV